MDNDTIRKLLDEATPGPWTKEPSRNGLDVLISGENWAHFARICTRMIGEGRDDPEGLANADLLLGARYAFEEVLRLRAELAALKEPPHA